MRLCLGTVQFGMDYGIQGSKRKTYGAVEEMLVFAIDHGIDIFDTAAIYGDAEKILGLFFRKNQKYAKKIRIVSKIPGNAFENADKREWENIAVKYAGQSADAVGIDCFEAYLFHDATYIFDKNAVKALYKVREKGISNHVGVSIYSPEEAMKALDYDEIDVIQIPYNVFDQRLDRCGFFDKARRRNVTVFARSSLLQGLIAMDEDSLPAHMNFAKGYLNTYRNICLKYHISPVQSAAGYVGSHPGIDYVTFGADSLKQLKEYISLRDIAIPNELIQDIRDAFTDVEERLVNPTLWKKEEVGV